MSLRALTINVRQFLDVRPGEAARIGLMAAFLFFLLAANNVIKIVRDSLFGGWGFMNVVSYGKDIWQAIFSSVPITKRRH